MPPPPLSLTSEIIQWKHLSLGALWDVGYAWVRSDCRRLLRDQWLPEMIRRLGPANSRIARRLCYELHDWLAATAVDSLSTTSSATRAAALKSFIRLEGIISTEEQYTWDVANVDSDADTVDGTTPTTTSRTRILLRGLPPMHDLIRWRNPTYHQIVLERFVEPSTNVRNRQRMERHIVTDFEDGRHDYYIDGIKRSAADGWLSASGILGKLYPHFDEVRISNRLAKTAKKGIYAGKTPDVIMKMWEENRNRGTRRHAGFDHVLQHPFDPEPFPPGSEKPPPGFYRCMANLLQRYEILHTEMGIADRASKFLGVTDLVLLDRVTGKVVFADFKNCVDANLFAEDSFTKTGRHPFTWKTSDTKGDHYVLQISLYRYMAIKNNYFPGRKVSKKILIINFRPEDPDSYELYPCKALDLHAFDQTYLPWNDASPVHTQYPHKTLIPAFPDDDIRCQGTTVHYCKGEYKCLPDEIKKQRPTIIASKLRAFKHPWKFEFDEPYPPSANAFYDYHLRSDFLLLQRLDDIKGKSIICWCQPGAPCHLSVVAKYSNLLENHAWKMPWTDPEPIVVVDDEEEEEEDIIQRSNNNPYESLAIITTESMVY